MSRLIIRQIPGNEPATFLLIAEDGTSPPTTVRVRSPRGYPVPGAGNRDLLDELGWYLERFLDYPFSPAIERADALQIALKSWGQDAFNELFGSPAAVRLLDVATRDGYHALSVEISSDDPGVLGWPWEVLHSPEKGWLAHHCAISRRLNAALAPPALPDNLPPDRLNILLVTARPYENDVAYRAMSRPLVELMERGQVPGCVHILRPPTLQMLRQHLRDRPGHYHVLHFDGHGAYRPLKDLESSTPDRSRFLALAQGHLIFETEAGQPHSIAAETLSSLLAEHRIPAVVMNACQSGQVDEFAEDAFASVAASLLRSGVGGVVAMAHSLFVSGAEEFLPAFYMRLFETGDLAEAVRAGRQQMLLQEKRRSPRGRFPLKDWLVPVLYAHYPVLFGLGTYNAGERSESVALPPEARETENPHGFVGRDWALLQLERAMRLPRPGILIQGLGGVGKTTLARGFLEWLSKTGGLGRGAFWFQFDEISSAEYVLNRLGEPIFGGVFATLTTPEKAQHLGRVLSAEPFIVVWDNFEVVRGNELSGVEARLPAEDQSVLKELLKRLRGGRSKVLITSRSEEKWLGEDRRILPLGGLVGEERWAYVDIVLRELGIAANRQDMVLLELIDLLEGHPLAMRILLPKLEERSAAELVEALKANVAALGLETHGVDGMLWGTLNLLEQALPIRLHGLLYPLGLHERHVDANYFGTMAAMAELPQGQREVNELMEILEGAGLVQHLGQRIYQLHPLLTGFLRGRSRAATQDVKAETWRQSFVMVFAHLSEQVKRLQLHQKKGFLNTHGANVSMAHHLASEARMAQHAIALAQFRGGFALAEGRLEEATRLYKEMAEQAEQLGDEGRAAAAYDQLGRVAAEREAWDEAEKWYEQSLVIKERLQDGYELSLTYHHLGNVADLRGAPEEAEGWFQKSLELKERIGDEQGTAYIYHQLGIIVAKRRAWEEAESWFMKALAIKERFQDRHGIANTSNRLGSLAEQRGALEEAEAWYRKSLDIAEHLGYESGAASNYHALGRVVAAHGAWEEAESWFKKSLGIEERIKDQAAAANTYHALGILATKRGAWDEAEGWYRKSLAIIERLQDENVAHTYFGLGRLAEEREIWGDAEEWYQKALSIRERLLDARGVSAVYHQLGNLATARQAWEQAEAWYQKSLAIDEGLGNAHGAALMVAQIAMIAREQGRLLDACMSLVEAAQRCSAVGDLHMSYRVATEFQRTIALAAPEDALEMERLWKEAGLIARG